MRMMRVSGHEQVRLYELEGYGHRMVDPAIPLVLAEIKRVKSARFLIPFIELASFYHLICKLKER